MVAIAMIRNYCYPIDLPSSKFNLDYQRRSDALTSSRDKEKQTSGQQRYPLTSVFGLLPVLLGYRLSYKQKAPPHSPCKKQWLTQDRCSCALVLGSLIRALGQMSSCASQGFPGCRALLSYGLPFPIRLPSCLVEARSPGPQLLLSPQEVGRQTESNPLPFEGHRG